MHLRHLIAGAIALAMTGTVSRACTIFVLTDAEETLFFNNEDWKNPVTRIWFIPGGADFYGAVYVGFDNGIGQGGMNTEGLALDWVSGYRDAWNETPGLTDIRGDYTKRVLERCATVEEAVAFIRKHPHPELRRARPLIADKSGASVIVGVRNGEIFFDREHTSRGFGFANQQMRKLQSEAPAPSIDNGFDLLRSCEQRGQTPTRYSNAFDLRQGTIHVRHESATRIATLNLDEELKRGPHYYVIKDLHREEGPESEPLELNMNRHPLDLYPPLEDQDPVLNQRIRQLVEDLRQGEPNPKHYTAEAWKEIQPETEDIRRELAALGPLRSIKLAQVIEEGDAKHCVYRMEFQRALILHKFVLNKAGQFVSGVSMSYEPTSSD